MKSILRVVLVVGALVVGVAALARVVRVKRAAAAIPAPAEARESGGRTRYFPRIVSWDDRSSARVQRIFAFSSPVGLTAIAREANTRLAARGWYLVMPEDLDRAINPQVVIWQRDPDERLDLSQLWPVEGMTRTQRLYGGIFPQEFLDAPFVIEWSWALGGPRSSPPVSPSRAIVQPAPPPRRP